MRIRTTAALAALMSICLSAAVAQDEAEPETAPSDELDALLGNGSESDELDALSQSADDPFAMMNENVEREPVSVTLRALDKITARYNDIEAPIGEMVKFGSLEILPRFCDKRPPEEFPETTAFLEIFDRDLARARANAAAEGDVAVADKAVKIEPAVAPSVRDISAGKDIDLPTDKEIKGPDPALTAADPDRIFSGWMFASSPGLNALENPVYDVWVIDCKTVVVEE